MHDFKERAQSMTDEEYRQQVQQRWKESMALLGLDDAGPAPEPPKAKPVETQPTPAAALPTQEDAADVHAEPDWPAARHEPEPVEPEAFQAEQVPAEPVDEFELTNQPGEAPRARTGRPRRSAGRRRRGRRGRRGGRDESTPGPADGPDTSRAEREVQPANPPRRTAANVIGAGDEAARTGQACRGGRHRSG